MKVTQDLAIDDSELKISFMRSPGPGGQNVNKVATGVHLRFNITHSPSLSEDIRARLIVLVGKKLTSTGDIIIRATRYRTQNRNKEDAIQRLREFIQKAAEPPKKRKKTKPSQAAKTARIENKKMRAKTKNLRKDPPFVKE